jgi:Ca2+-binding RTX toxin-like protein
VESISWRSSLNGDWFTGSNWASGAVPTASDDPVVNSGSPFISTGKIAIAHSLVLNSGSSLTDYGTLTLSGTLTLNAGSTINLQGGTLTAQLITSTSSQYGFINGYGTINGDLASGIYLGASSGTLVITGSSLSNYTASIYQNATLEFKGTSITGAYFQSTQNSTLQLDDAAHYTGAIGNVAVGDTIDLRNISATNVTYSGTTLVVSYGAGQTLNFNVSGSLTGDSVSYASDTHGGTNISWVATGSSIVAPINLANAAISNGYVNSSNDLSNQTLTGTATSGATVTIYDGTTKLGTTTANANGVFSFNLGVLSDGSHSLTASATDGGGNVSPGSSPLAFYVDTSAPNGPTTLGDASISNGIVNAANDTITQVLTGSAEAGSTITVYDGTTKLGTAAANASGAFSFTLGALSDGSHSLTATATDAAGNIGSASAALSLKVDTVAPAAPTSLSDSSVSEGFVNASGNTLTQVLTGGAEAGSTVTIFDGSTKLGATTATSSGAFSFTLGQLSDGSHSLTAAATDTAGNIGAASSTLSFKVDTLAPAAPTTLSDSAISGGFVAASANTSTQALTGTAEAGSTVAIFDGATKLGTTTANASGAFSFTLGQLSTGSHSLTATATDAAGNVGVASGALSFQVGAVAVNVPTTLTDSAIVGGYVNASGNVISQVLTGIAAPNATVTIYDGTTKLGTVAANSNGAFAFFLGQLSEGSHSITATATDSGGNVGAASAALSFKVDTIAPTAPTALSDSSITGGYINSTGNTSSSALTGTAEAGSTVTVYDGTTKLGTTTANASGAFSFTLGALSDGSHSLTAAATDAAGNIGAASSTLSFKVDTLAPAAPTTLSDSAISGGFVNASGNISTQVLTGTAEAGSTVTLFDGTTKLGTTTANTSGAFSYTLGQLSDGSHSLTATATDAAGNVGTASGALAFKVDSLAPVAPTKLSDSAISNGFVGASSNTSTQVLTGTAEAGSTVTFFDGTTKLGTTTANSSGAFSFTLGQLSDGSHSLTATATDAAGNVGAASSSLAFKVDTVAPIAPTGLADASVVAGFVGASGNSLTQVLTGTAEAGSAVAIFDGATKLGTTVANSSGAFSFTLGQLSDGAHSLTATATDAAGNVGTASGALAFKVDVNGLAITGDSGDNILVAGPGNDTLTGNGGADTFYAGAGSDTFVYLPGDSTAGALDQIYGFKTGQDKIDLSGINASSISIVRSGDGSVIFADAPGAIQTVIAINGLVQAGDIIGHGGQPSVNLVAGSANAVLIGGSNSDQLFGNDGNDTLQGGGGADYLFGGAGSDTFVYKSITDSTPAQTDLIADFQTGIDKIDLSAIGINHISTIDNGTAEFVFIETTSGQIMQLNFVGPDSIQAADFNVTGGTNLYMQGDSGNNTLIGGAGNDVIDGHGGNDLIIGGGASDALFGGGGQDTFKYLAVTDSLPGSGADTIFDFQTGQDQIDLTSLGINHISTIDNGTAEFVFIETKSGQLMQINFVGADAIQAADFNVRGGTNYYIQGDSGNNTLIGGNGQDVIDGHGGNDLIIGGGGSDALFGGAGNDTFKYLAASDSTVAAPDTIFDFTSGTDKIDLTAVHTSSKDVFNILVSGGASYIFIDLGGDGTNDMLIQATGTVTASDILWNKPSDVIASIASAAPPMHTDEFSAYQISSDFAPDQGEPIHAWNNSIFQAHTMQPSDLLHV